MVAEVCKVLEAFPCLLFLCPLPGHKERRQADGRGPTSQLGKGPRCGRANSGCVEEEGDVAATAAGKPQGPPRPQLCGPLVALGAWRV